MAISTRVVPYDPEYGRDEHTEYVAHPCPHCGQPLKVARKEQAPVLHYQNFELDGTTGIYLAQEHQTEGGEIRSFPRTRVSWYCCQCDARLNGRTVKAAGITD